jgi:hypothetical protein
VHRNNKSKEKLYSLELLWTTLQELIQNKLIKVNIVISQELILISALQNIQALPTKLNYFTFISYDFETLSLTLERKQKEQTNEHKVLREIC